MNKSTVVVSLAGKVHPITGEPIEPIGIVNGRVVWPIMGGAPKDDEDDDDDQDDEDDDDADDADEDDDDSDDDEDDELTPAQLAAVERAANRIADRRINQLNRRKKRSRNTRRSNDNDDDDNNQNRRNSRNNDRNDDTEDAPSASDAREARLVYRESVPDLITFNSRAEREASNVIARGLIAQNLTDGLDVADAGEAAAEDTAKTLNGLRRSIRESTIRRLKRDGTLPADFVLKKQPKRGRQRPGRQEPNANTGKAIAEGIFADRIAAREKQNQ